MSKWDGLKGKFPDAPLADPSFRDKVTFTKDEHKEKTLPELILMFSSVSEEYDEHSAAIKNLNVSFEAVGQLIAEKLEELGLNEVKTSLGKKIIVDITPLTSIADGEAFENFVNADPELKYLWGIKWPSVNAMVKDLLEQGKDDEVPPGLKIYLKRSVKLKDK
jgi:hypothetical protein